MPLPIGLVHYKYGLGTGKTTSIIGLLIRAIGQGLRVILIQFLKCTMDCEESTFTSGEYNFLLSLESTLGSIPIHQFGRPRFIQPGEGPMPEDYELARKGLDFARNTIQSGEYDVVALDEIMDTVYFGLIDIAEIENLIQNKPPTVELVLSGHQDYPDIHALADYVTEFVPVKHPYDRGISARKGIEY